ncbi:hypothetical protein PsYK624_015120 [Phanerochaete sordida]|uniref:Uncharacterized protein n=1 Tax=Phanerochaete sordida TaxID=48140 RepID=A0A9P3FZG1_9APHY|nr:hypothetical protein PsYK624_015120 [Phanerochaete sordida]
MRLLGPELFGRQPDVSPSRHVGNANVLTFVCICSCASKGGASPEAHHRVIARLRRMQIVSQSACACATRFTVSCRDHRRFAADHHQSTACSTSPELDAPHAPQLNVHRCRIRRGERELGPSRTSRRKFLRADRCAQNSHGRRAPIPNRRLAVGAGALNASQPTRVCDGARRITVARRGASPEGRLHRTCHTGIQGRLMQRAQRSVHRPPNYASARVRDRI